MPAGVAAFVSFRLGGTDGVSVEAGKWERALCTLGFSTRRIAGEILDARRSDDCEVPELAIGAAVEPSPVTLERALDGADLVVVDNLLSLPLNLGAARVVAKVLDGRDRVVLRHHDLPWQRREHAHVTELPPPLSDAVHITINDRSRRELANRGISATTVRNHFDFSAAPGDRATTRAALGLGDHDLLVLHPVRAIPRKNVPGALAFVGELADRLGGRHVHYWLPGPAEDGYEADLGELLDSSRLPVLREQGVPMPDAYAACDLVVFPSTWEGFGNPVIESVVFRRPLAVARYPTLEELLDLGLEFYDIGDADGVADVLAGGTDPRPTLAENARVARRHLSVELLPARLEALLSSAGWTP